MSKPELTLILRTAIVAVLAMLPVGSQAQGLSGLPSVLDRVSQQQVDKAQTQAADRAQAQATDRAQAQAVEKAADKAQQQIDSALQRTSEQAQTQQQNKVQSQVVDRVGSQVERAQTQAADRAQSQVERTGQRVDQAQNKAAEKAVTRTNTLPVQAAERPIGNAAAATVNGQQRNADAQSATGNNTAGASAGAGAGTTATAATSPAQNTVRTANGGTAFVEVTLQPGVRAVAFEWVMMVTPQQRQQLSVESAQLLQFLTSSRANALAGGEVLTFSVPPDLDANDAILNLVPANLRGQIDRNHLYASQSQEHAATLPLALPFAAVCDAPVTVGMIDSAIDVTHPAFARIKKSAARIKSRTFVEENLVTSIAHGTTIASVLVGSHDEAEQQVTLRPLLPNATLYSAAVFHESNNVQQGATVSRLLAAIDWLVSVPQLNVINMSLAGPPNRLLAQAVTAARQRGKLIVAATGNEGPSGPPRYPAAYEDAVGVTAVDRDGNIFRWANQGPQVAFAALGVAVPAADGKSGFAPQSGTSVATPVVSAFLACAMQHQASADAALSSVTKQAIDLGKPGKDPVFGQGLLHPGMPHLLSEDQ